MFYRIEEIIDPPYFLQLKRKRLRRWDSKTLVKGVFEEWDSFSSFEEYDGFIESLLLGVKRVMKPNATLWVIGTYHNIFRVGKRLGVRFTNATETLIWAVKDKSVKKYTFNREYAKSFGIGKVGANQKPIELLKRVILTSTKEGDLILDPLAGTGTTGYAAKMLGRDFVLIGKNPQYVQLINERLSQSLLK